MGHSCPGSRMDEERLQGPGTAQVGARDGSSRTAMLGQGAEAQGC